MSLYRLAALTTSPVNSGKLICRYLEPSPFDGEGGPHKRGGMGTKKGRCTKFQLRATAPSDLWEFVETVAVFVDDLRHHPFPINIGMQTVGGELWI